MADKKVSICDHIHAGYPILWIETHEEDRAIKIIAECLKADADSENPYIGLQWDIAYGFTPAECKGESNEECKDPIDCLENIKTLLVDQEKEKYTFYLKDFHRFTANIAVARRVKNLIPHLKDSQSRIILVGPKTEIPIELEKDITVCEFDLPEKDEIKKIADGILKASLLDDVKYDTEVLDAAIGLTSPEAENAIALSLAHTGSINREIIEYEKLSSVRKSGLLEQYPEVEESQLGGLKPLKDYIHSRKSGFENPDLPRPKGIILVGLPGAGKSLSAKVIANALKYPLLRFDISSMKGSLVGESETKMRQALKMIDAVAPAVVWIDEIEKALGGVQSSNRTDGGTTSAMFGYLLTWMQERKKPKYIVATCNDIDDLLSISQGALLRRFDDIFFLDVPSRKERVEILKIMNDRYKQNLPEELVDNMDNWTGAEIEKCVIASAYEGITKAMEMTKPIYKKNKERIDIARRWAKENARLANEVDTERKASSSLEDVLDEARPTGRKITPSGPKNAIKKDAE